MLFAACLMSATICLSTSTAPFTMRRRRRARAPAFLTPEAADAGGAAHLEQINTMTAADAESRSRCVWSKGANRFCCRLLSGAPEEIRTPDPRFVV